MPTKPKTIEEVNAALAKHGCKARLECGRAGTENRYYFFVENINGQPLALEGEIINVSSVSDYDFEKWVNEAKIFEALVRM